MNNSNLVILLVSDQTIPNVQFLKYMCNEVSNEFDILFISTERMEKQNQTNLIWKAAQINSCIKGEKHVIEILHNDMYDIQNKIEAFLKETKYDQFYVNITCGTKIMSVSAFDVFTKQQNSQIYYQTSGNEMSKIYPNPQKLKNVDITLEEYLTAYNIQLISSMSDQSIESSYDEIMEIYQNTLLPNFHVIQILTLLQNSNYFKDKLKGKTLDFENIDEEKFRNVFFESLRKANSNIIQSFGIDANEFKKIDMDSPKEKILNFLRSTHINNLNTISSRDISFFTGVWFEQLFFKKLKKKYPSVLANVKIEKNNTTNELDIIYIDEYNKLNIIECKSFLEGKDGQSILKEALYKAQAIKSEFGLEVKSHLYTMSAIDKESELKRAEEFKIDIHDRNEFLK